MEWQLNALSNLGLLSRFVGMVTDSRSFMSYPRHEYFRRVLCNLIGRDVENGEIPDDDSLLGPMIHNICYANAQQYLQLPAKGSNRETRNRRLHVPAPGFIPRPAGKNEHPGRWFSPPNQRTALSRNCLGDIPVACLNATQKVLAL